MKIITIVAFITASISCQRPESKKTGLEGKPLPDFTLILADSTTYFQTRDIPQGKPVALFYFGPFCPYSRALMQEIVNKIEILKDIQFYVFTDWPFNEMKDFYNKYKLHKYSNITVGVDYAQFFPHYFKLKGVPYIAIYGKSKKLKGLVAGEISAHQMKELCSK